MFLRSLRNTSEVQEWFKWEMDFIISLCNNILSNKVFKNTIEISYYVWVINEMYQSGMIENNQRIILLQIIKDNNRNPLLPFVMVFVFLKYNFLKDDSWIFIDAIETVRLLLETQNILEKDDLLWEIEVIEDFAFWDMEIERYICRNSNICMAIIKADSPIGHHLSFIYSFLQKLVEYWYLTLEQEKDFIELLPESSYAAIHIILLEIIIEWWLEWDITIRNEAICMVENFFASIWDNESLNMLRSYLEDTNFK